MPAPILRRFVDAARALATKLRKRDSAAPLPAAAQLVAVQHPSATLPARPYDLVLVGTVLALLGIGTVEIYSATAAESLTHFGDAAHFLERQLGYAVVGGLAMWLGARIDYRRLRDLTYPLLFGGFLLLG